MSADDPTDAERFPTLTAHGARMLAFLREHPAAPIFRNESGNRLRPHEVEAARAFARQVATAPPAWTPGTRPPWLEAFVAQCRMEVPFYRRYPASAFEDLPTISRADLSHDIAAFVPDSVPLDRLINFRTSGTTGHPLLIASHPTVAANYLAFHRKALARAGIELRHGRGQVGVVLLGFQRKCFTYVSVTPTLDEAGLAKINLYPDDWRHPDDRARYLDALDAEILTGDPLAFAELLRLPLRTRPRAILSTSMTLLPAFRRELETRFACPVLDLYSMNEAGPIAVGVSDGHALLQPRMFVEILAPDGSAMPLGERGEITLTGGFNPWLPLLRYRTGDHARLAWSDGEWRLLGLEGRPPVVFRHARGEFFNNIEVTHALKGLPLAQWTLHQQRSGALHFRWCGPAGCDAEIRRVLSELFGACPMVVEQVPVFEGKVIQYTTEER
jgi:phenylacetate-CoA ligase